MKFDQVECQLILEGAESNRDYLSLSDGDRLLTEIKPGAGSGKGKNSCVFRAVHPESGDDVIVKLCCFPEGVQTDVEVRKRQRFLREIGALQMATERQLGDFLITYYEHGRHSCDGYVFDYYVMEEADCDLSDYLAKSQLTLQQKLVLCRSLLQDLSVLHGLGIYHRDLKPDNVFFVGNQWKIGDLGFIKHRDDDASIDEPRERIGPTGLMSPEAINKAYANLENEEFVHDCVFDDLSDVYLLGGVFWYILQGNFPTGQIQSEDFKLGRDDILNQILLPMLQHAKVRRPSLSSLSNQFEHYKAEFAL
jgi:serine/threonine protein kinase